MNNIGFKDNKTSYGLSKEIKNEVTWSNIKEQDMLSNIKGKHAEQIKFKYEIINKVINSTEMWQMCPSYLGQRQKSQNIELVKTTLAVLQLGLLTQAEVISLLEGFATQCKKNSDDYKDGKLKGDYTHSRYTRMENLT